MKRKSSVDIFSLALVLGAIKQLQITVEMSEFQQRFQDF